MPSRASSTSPASGPLAGRTIVITRPAGTGSDLARQVRKLGGVPLLLPGLSLRAAPDADATRKQWLAAQHDSVLIFTSPAAVRHAFALAPCDTRAVVIAVGQATARALRRHGIEAQQPQARQNSEGVLQLAAMQALRGKRIALITAPAGRGLLQAEIAARGAQWREVHVYARAAPRLHRRHVLAVSQLPPSACVLLSSGEAIRHLLAQLPAPAWRRLCAATAIVSSARIGEEARAAGFQRLHQAASANQGDLLAAARALCSHLPHEAGGPGC